MNNQIYVTVRGRLSSSRLRGADTQLLYFSTEHMSSLRDRST